MKTNSLIMAGLLVLSQQQPGRAQSDFVNLDFEGANVPDLPPNQYGGLVPPSQAIPGWQAYFEGQETSDVAHNNISIGGAAVSLFGPTWIVPEEILQGKYSVEIHDGLGDITAGIGQTGVIPDTARSLLFKTDPDSLSILQVSFGGHPVPLFLKSSYPTYDVLEGDISTYAGETGELLFTTHATAILDEITFSSRAVPEPSVLSLIAGGLGLLGFCSWRESVRR